MGTDTAPTPARSRGIAYWAVLALAVVILCAGMPIFAGGVWLIMLGGSVFYAAAGAGLFLAGFFMIRMSMMGFWFYVLTFAGTAAWTFADVGADFQALWQRLALPGVILLLTMLAVPCLLRKGFAAARPSHPSPNEGTAMVFPSRHRSA